MLVGHLQWSGGEEEMVGARLVWADFFFFLSSSGLICHM